MIEVKICGLCRPRDARVAHEVGADYLGVVFASSPRRQDAESARAVWDVAPGRRAGVFANADHARLVATARDLGLHVLQLHGDESPDACRRIADAGDWAVWKSVRLGPDSRLEESLDRYAGSVSGILLEGWSPRGLGGVGAGFDWSRATRARDVWPAGLRLIVAGGLTPETVGAAVAALRPDVVDVSSGVESAIGVKDPAAVARFVEAARHAARAAVEP